MDIVHSDRQLSVLMLSSDYLPQIGGVASHVHHLSRALVRQGVAVTVLNPVAEGSGPSASRLEEQDGVLVARVAWTPSGNKLLDVAARVRACMKAVHHVPAFDLLHQHDYRSSVVIAQVLSRRYRSAFVYTNHTSDFLANATRAKQRVMDRLAWTGADALIAPSKELKDVTEAVLKQPAIRVPNGVALESFRLRVAEPEGPDFVVLCPRRMDPKNGVEFLALALQLLPAPRQHAKWRIVFMGDGDSVNVDRTYADKVRQITLSAPRHVRVDFVGNVPPSEMPEWYRRAHVVAMPSLVEAISLSALEGMATGVPVVASRVGGLAELVLDGETGVLVPPRDPESLADALQMLEADADARHRLAQSARREVERQYSWDHVAAETAAVYRNAMRRTGARSLT